MTTDNIESTIPVEVSPIEAPKDQTENKAPTVPRNLFSGFSELLREQQVLFVKQVADNFDLDVGEVMKKCIPDAPDMKEAVAKKAPKVKKEKLTNYKDAAEKSDLKAFKMPELKDILEEHGLAISGSKPKLMDRVWGILHPDEAPKEETKKRGRKKKSSSTSKDTTTIDMQSDTISAGSDTAECEMDPSTMPDFYVKDGVKVDSEEGATVLKLFKKKWLFQEGEEELEFKGILAEDAINWTDDVPVELLKILGMDD